MDKPTTTNRGKQKTRLAVIAAWAGTILAAGGGAMLLIERTLAIDQRLVRLVI